MARNHIPEPKGNNTEMLSSIKQRLDREDEGFTLIELMVVVLIIAILLAIAIPTFLGARNSANARSAQSDLRNALTAEQTEWTNTQAFSQDTTTAGMKGLESSLNWVSGAPTKGNNVSVAGGDPATASGSDYQAVELQAQGADGNCYTVVQSNDPTSSFTAYQVTKSACAGASAPSTLATYAPHDGSASASANVGGWYTSW